MAISASSSSSVVEASTAPSSISFSLNLLWPELVPLKHRFRHLAMSCVNLHMPAFWKTLFSHQPLYLNSQIGFCADENTQRLGQHTIFLEDSILSLTLSSSSPPTNLQPDSVSIPMSLCPRNCWQVPKG